LDKIRNISFVGSGNVATHLATALFEKGIAVNQVYSKTPQNAQILAKKVNATAICEINKLQKSDLIIVAVKDDAIQDVLNQMDGLDNVVHTSGSISIAVFPQKINNYGIFYPLQTFSKSKSVDWTELPILIEANEKDFENKLMHLAQQLTNKVYIVNSQQRKLIHLAAVFSCNFSNYLNIVSQSILANEKLDFEILHPLIQETLNKMITIGPEKSQTGPAIRKDQKVIDEHLLLLENIDKNYAEIYKLLTSNIQKHFKQ
jgi:predicted short-subunit dehydrogenase-like oxidoreductase (DUF2520 family)